MAGRPPKSPKANKTPSSSPLHCEKCGTILAKDNAFCASCGSARPRSTTGRPSSAETPPQEDRTYQDPLFVNGVYHCPKCNAILEAGTKRCGVCGVMFINPVPQARTSAGASAPNSGATRPQGGPAPPSACPHCKSPLNFHDQFCAACGSAQSHTYPDPQPASGSSIPPSVSENTAPPLQRAMSSAWFHKLWRGAGAAWRWGLLALFLFSLWSIGSRVVYYFQGVGMNGVYEASDGAGEVTFWPNGIYLMTSMGMQTPGKYRLRNNGTVDMAAQFDTLTHPAPSTSPEDQGAHAFLGLLASGMGEGVVSSDKNTFQWQGNTYSYDHKPTTGPPAVPDPSAPQPSSPQ